MYAHLQYLLVNIFLSGYNKQNSFENEDFERFRVMKGTQIVKHFSEIIFLQ